MRADRVGVVVAQMNFEVVGASRDIWDPERSSAVAQGAVAVKFLISLEMRFRRCDVFFQSRIGAALWAGAWFNFRLRP